MSCHGCVQFTIFQCASVQIHKDVWLWCILFAQSCKLTLDLYMLDKYCSSNMCYFKHWCTCYFILYYYHNKTITYLPKRVCLCLHYPAMQKATLTTLMHYCWLIVSVDITKHFTILSLYSWLEYILLLIIQSTIWSRSTLEAYGWNFPTWIMRPIHILDHFYFHFLGRWIMIMIVEENIFNTQIAYCITSRAKQDVWFC